MNHVTKALADGASCLEGLAVLKKKTFYWAAYKT
jgi:hypothetical protein